MRELLSMWRNKRMVALTLAIALVYTSVLVPFKHLGLLPGFSTIRPANALPVVFGLMFGPAAAWGSMFGNLAGDFLGGTWSAASYPGAVGNFFTAFIVYRLWGNLGGLSTGKLPDLATSDQFPEYLVVSFTAGSLTAAIIGLGTELTGLIPFPIIVLTIVFNNTLAELFLGPPLLYLLYPRAEKRGLLYQQLLEDRSLPSGNRFQRPAAIAIVLLSIGWVVAGSSYGIVVEHITIQDIIAFEPLQAIGSTVQVGGGAILFVVISGASVLAGERISKLSDRDGKGAPTGPAPTRQFAWLDHQSYISGFAIAGLGITLAVLYETALFARLSGGSDPLSTLGLQIGSGLILPALLLWGGWRLRRTGYARDRIWRITLWTFGGTGVVTIFSAWQFYQLYLGMPSSSRIIETFLLSVHAGAIGGLVVGIYDARADWTSEALAAERETLKRQNERLEKFAGIVSHDLRNPLNAAQLRLDLLGGDGDDEHVREVAANLERMDAMIDDLLELSRAGATVEDPADVPLADVAAESWDTARTADAEVEIDLPDSVTVQADRDRLRRVFENLFRNAVDHNTPPPTITVGLVDGTPAANGGPTVGFFVEDDGGGIPADDRQAVFEHGYSTNDDGTGFGLSIVHDIAEAHDWDVRVTEGADGGARFEITGVATGARTE